MRADAAITGGVSCTDCERYQSMLVQTWYEPTTRHERNTYATGISSNESVQSIIGAIENLEASYLQCFPALSITSAIRDPTPCCPEMPVFTPFSPCYWYNVPNRGSLYQMGTIRERNGRFTAQIRIMRDGQLIHQQAQTFERRAVAAAWMKKREVELAEPGALERLRAKDPPLADVIDQYIQELGREAGHTKSQCLRTIKADYDIAHLKCSEIDSAAIGGLARQLAARGIEASTIGNYLSHLSAVVKVARPLWRYPLDPQAMADASIALRATKVIGKSKQRERRPTLDELDKLMTHFGRVRHKRKDSIPMQAIVAFGIFSTRRMEEILRIAWADFDEAGSRVLVRDMKDPKEKSGNHLWCELPPEALRIIQAQPRVGDRIFPASVDAVGAAFTRACQSLRISDPDWPDEKNLHFHDLRHDGISRLFEMGRNIPQVACVSGHRSWNSLKRYTHIRQSGDKYAGWPWLAVVT